MRRYQNYSSNYFKKNRENLLQKLPENSIAVFFSSDQMVRNQDVHYPWRQDSNFFYLTGIDQVGAVLILIPDSEKKSEILFVPAVDPTMEQWEGKMLSISDAKKISGINTVHIKNSFEGMFYREQKYKHELFTDVNEVFSDQALTSYHLFLKKIRDRIPGLIQRKASLFLSELRVIKSEEEIEKIKLCMDFSNEALHGVMKKIEPGLMEYQLEAELTYHYLNNGCSRLGFESIVAGGKNATTLHYTENSSILKDGDLVLIDNGGEYAMFTSDITRVFPINGKFSERQAFCYQTVLDIQKEIIKQLKVGMQFKKIHEIANQIYGRILVERDFIKKAEDHKELTLHSVTHYLGLDVHDVGSQEWEIQPGMVFTMEPGLYLKEEGIGIRIEDDILCTKNGFEILSKDIPKEIDEIENIINS